MGNRNNNKEQKQEEFIGNIINVGENIPELRKRLIKGKNYSIQMFEKDVAYKPEEGGAYKRKFSRKMKFLGFCGKKDLLLLFQLPKGYKTTFSWIEIRLGHVSIVEINKIIK